MPASVRDFFIAGHPLVSAHSLREDFTPIDKLPHLLPDTPGRAGTCRFYSGRSIMQVPDGVFLNAPTPSELKQHQAHSPFASEDRRYRRQVAGSESVGYPLSSTGILTRPCPSGLLSIQESSMISTHQSKLSDYGTSRYVSPVSAAILSAGCKHGPARRLSTTRRCSSRPEQFVGAPRSMNNA